MAAERSDSADGLACRIDVLAASPPQSITAYSEDRTFLGGFVLQSIHVHIKQ